MKANKRNESLIVSLPEDHLGYWLRYVSNNVDFTFSRKLAASGVTVAEWIILRQMYRQEGVSAIDIAVRTGLTQGAVSKLIERLLNKGFLVKETSAEDRRYKKIKLTQAGQRIVPHLARIADNNDNHFFGEFSLRQKNELINLLKSLVKTHHLRKALSMKI